MKQRLANERRLRCEKMFLRLQQIGAITANTFRLSLFMISTNLNYTTGTFPMKTYPALSWLCALAVLCSVVGCAPLDINNGAFSPSHQRYTVSVPDKGWEPMRVDKEDIALWHKQCRAMIAIISSSTEGKGLPVEILNSHLFIGMKDNHIVAKEHAMVSNQDALHTTLECVMEDRQLKVESYSFKAGGAVYDLVFWAPPDLFDCAKGDFEQVVKTFRLIINDKVKSSCQPGAVDLPINE